MYAGIPFRPIPAEYQMVVGRIAAKNVIIRQSLGIFATIEDLWTIVTIGAGKHSNKYSVDSRPHGYGIGWARRKNIDIPSTDTLTRENICPKNGDSP